MKALFGKIVGFIKAHPYITGLAVFFIGLIIVMRSRSASSGVDDGIYIQGSEVNSSLQLAQLQAQAMTNQTNAQSAVAQQGIAADLEKTKLAAQVAINANDLTASTQQMIAQLQAQTTQAVSTLQATVAGKSIDAQTQQLQIATQGQIDIASLPYQLEALRLSAGTPAQIKALQDQIAAVEAKIPNYKFGDQIGYTLTGKGYNGVFYGTALNANTVAPFPEGYGKGV